ncbi:hypothetical protein ZIOFF_018666 [Zingiber officinale]|uniref:Uncharacterized protein n=1 Tax=Zingiber officinale TaxID=94328 RepID=A0A8J5HGP9_ZINOF|nr:hypothetical protein ZIOFF_018666 [Zingiber officinale]
MKKRRLDGDGKTARRGEGWRHKLDGDGKTRGAVKVGDARDAAPLALSPLWNLVESTYQRSASSTTCSLEMLSRPEKEKGSSQHRSISSAFESGYQLGEALSPADVKQINAFLSGYDECDGGDYMLCMALDTACGVWHGRPCQALWLLLNSAWPMPAGTSAHGELWKPPRNRAWVPVVSSRKDLEISHGLCKA